MHLNINCILIIQHRNTINLETDFCYFTFQGVYQIYLTLNIVDDLGNKVTLRFNVTLEAKNDANEGKFFVPHLGGL